MSFFCSNVVAGSPPRVPRLQSWRDTLAGYVRMATCKKYSHVAALPIEQLIMQWGAEIEIEAALSTLLCSGCGERAVAVKLLMLCEPGCRRRRS